MIGRLRERVSRTFETVSAKLPGRAAKSPTATPSTRGGSSSRTVETKEGRKRVLISDDSDQGDGGSVVGSARFRQRRIDTNRSEGRRRLRVAIIIGSVVGVVILVLALLASPLLAVRNISVEGVVYADPEQVAAVVESIHGEPILTADLHQAEVRLKAIPWVLDARVSMRLPSTVTIEVVERAPVAWFRAVDGFNRVVDRTGRVLDVIEGDPVDYTLVVGTGPSIAAGAIVDQPFLGAVQLIASLPAELQSRLESSAVTPEGEVSLTLSGGVQVLFGPPDNFQTKLVGVVNEIKRQGSSPYSVIDVSSGEPSVR